MSVGVTSTTNSYFGRSSGPDPAAFSACGVTIVTDKGNGAPGTGQFGAIFSLLDLSTKWCQFGFDDFARGGAMVLTTRVEGSGTPTAFGATPDLNKPFFWYLLGGSSTLDGGWSYLGTPSFTTLSIANESQTIAEMSWLGDSFSEYVYGYMENLKIWDATMTAAQMQCEMFSRVPKNFASPHLWTPLPSTSDIKDHFSGTGRDWTSHGSGTVTGDGMPVGLGAGHRRRSKQAAVAPGGTGRFFFAASQLAA